MLYSITHKERNENRGKDTFVSKGSPSLMSTRLPNLGLKGTILRHRTLRPPFLTCIVFFCLLGGLWNRRKLFFQREISVYPIGRFALGCSWICIPWLLPFDFMFLIKGSPTFPTHFSSTDIVDWSKYLMELGQSK